MDTIDKHHCYRRLSAELSTSPSGRAEEPCLQRTRSVRASFRRLGARWKTPSSAASKTSVNVTGTPARQSAPDSHDSTGQPQIANVVDVTRTPGPLGSTSSQSTSRFDKHHQYAQYKNDLFARTKKTKHLKRTGGLRGDTKENWWPTDMPVNVPSKAAAILEIPVNAEQFNRNTSAWLMSGRTPSSASTAAAAATSGSTSSRSAEVEKPSSSGFGVANGQFRFLKRSVSLNEEARKKAEAKPRTATIRRGSVWANSTLSKTTTAGIPVCRVVVSISKVLF